MPQNDNATGKRARTDGGRREDDWNCPNCGNVNFSFRTSCNMRNCTQSRPANHNAKSAAKPLQAPMSHGSAGYIGPGAPPVYLSAPPYGSNLNGSSLASYNYPFSGGAGYGYGYGGGRISLGSPYASLHLSGPAPYSSGSMMGTGGMYGIAPLVSRFGLALPMGHNLMAQSPVAFVDEVSRKKTDRDDDWVCPSCGNNNFSFRTVCNMRKCNTPRPGGQAAKSENSKGSKQKMPEGSWKCDKCGNINYPFRTKCNRQHCAAEKPSEANVDSGVDKSDDDEQ